MSGLPATTLAPTRAKLIPVVEIFGPTIQGEGAEAGMATHFVRVGGCDFRCSWCDTMYAVDPEVVRATAEKLSSQEIVGRVADQRRQSSSPQPRRRRVRPSRCRVPRVRRNPGIPLGVVARRR
jgi:hypothetical protein